MRAARRARRLCAIGIGLALVVSACGGDDSDDGDATTSDPAPATTLDFGDAVPPSECVGFDPCDALISQAEGLADGDVVDVRVAGWEPDTVVGLAQCADPADPDNGEISLTPDGLPDGSVCNVLDLGGPAQSVTTDADGIVELEYEVVAGPTMEATSEAGMCDAEHDCVLNFFLSGANRFRADAPRVTFSLRFA